MHFDLDAVTTILGGELVGRSVPFDGAGIDSRRIDAGSLFVALVAERDGHEFVGDAAAAGAAAALVSRRVEVGLPQCVVGDTAAALTALGGEARRRLSGAVVGITGSVGKTTTKDLLAAVAARAGSVGASKGSLNNELGVPLTLICAPDGADRVLVEMGARGRGHIAALCETARPTVGVVTVVAAAHTEMFGDVEVIAETKGELIEALPVDGLAVLNAADPRVAAMADRSVAPVLTFGVGGDVHASGIRLDDEVRPHFTMSTPWGRAEVGLAVSGVHNITNALAASAAALGTGITLDVVVAGLAAAETSPWRMEVRRVRSGGWVINDAYNANPTSMRAALDALASLDASRRVAVLGPMAELGATEADDHRDVARYAHSLGIAVVGVGTALYGEPFCVDVDEAARLVGDPEAGTAVLVKGSRVAGLEALAERWQGTSVP